MPGVNRQGKRISYRPQSSHRDPARGLRQRLGFEHGFPLIAACEHQPNDQHQYCFHLCFPLLIVAGPFAIRQSKTILGAIL
jgi:hypothetical protein